MHEGNRARADEIDALDADITRLSLEIVDRKADVDRLLSMHQVLQDAGERAKTPKQMPLMPLSSASPSARPLAVGEIQDWLKESQLLTDAGRRGVRYRTDGSMVVATPKIQKMAVAALKARVDERASQILPTIRELQAAGATSLRALAAGLNEAGIPTARGDGTWSAVQVARILERA
jgi:hypothetical protein